MPGDALTMPMLENRLRKRYKHLKKWAAREGITAWRVYDRDIPELPLAIDLYGDKALVQVFRRGGTDEAALEDEARAALGAVAGVAPGDVHVRHRERRPGQWQYEKLGDARHETVVEEYGLRFLVNLTDYLDTGLFLDHRLTRRMVGELSRGRRVLNLFAYTGAFTVHAAAGGAAETTTVDLSNTYVAWAGRNLELNGLAGPRHHLVRADTFRFLEEATGRWDLIVVDPPTVSTSKAMQFKFDVQTGHPALLRATLRLLAPGGTIVFSNNFRGFRMDEAALPPCTAEEITKRTLPPDFRDEAVHRCWLVRHLASQAGRA